MHRKSLDSLLRKPINIKDKSFPGYKEVILQGDWLYWGAGTVAFVIIIAIAMANIWAGAEQSIVGAGNIENWLWHYSWWKKLLSLAWQQGAMTAIAFLFSEGNNPRFGNILDFFLLSWPLEILLGSKSYYNGKIALILFFNCWICWWCLAKLWGANIYSWAGALVFGLNSYFLNEISDGNSSSLMVFTIPIFIFEMFCVYRQSGEQSLVWAGILLGLTSALYMPYGLMLVAMLAIWIVWNILIGTENNAKFFKKCILVVLIGSALSLPLNWNYVASLMYSNDIDGVGTSWSLFKTFPKMKSADDIQSYNDYYMIDGTSQWYVPKFEDLSYYSAVKRVKNSFPVNSSVNFSSKLSLPLITVFVICIPWIKEWKIPLFWILLAMGSLILAWGPFITISDGEYLIVNDDSLSLPYAWFYRFIPFVSIIDPKNFLAIFYIALANLLVIRLCSLRDINDSLSKFICAIVIIAQIWQLGYMDLLPLRTVRLGEAPIYHLWKKAEKRGIIDIPNVGSYLDLGQNIHGFPRMGGSATKLFPSNWNIKIDENEKLSIVNAILPKDNTFINHLREWDLSKDKWETFEDNDRKSLVKDGYDLVVLHERSCNIVAGSRGEIMYFQIFSHLNSVLGSPILNSFEPVQKGLPGKRDVDAGNVTWYRISVFKLEK